MSRSKAAVVLSSASYSCSSSIMVRNEGAASSAVRVAFSISLNNRFDRFRSVSKHEHVQCHGVLSLIVVIKRPVPAFADKPALHDPTCPTRRGNGSSIAEYLDKHQCRDRWTAARSVSLHRAPATTTNHMPGRKWRAWSNVRVVRKAEVQGTRVVQDPPSAIR